MRGTHNPKCVIGQTVVSRWLASTDGCWHQQESPISGAVKKESLFSANSSGVIERGCEKKAQQCYSLIKRQHGCEVALGQDYCPAGQLWAGLDWTGLRCSGLLCPGLVWFPPVWSDLV